MIFAPAQRHLWRSYLVAWEALDRFPMEVEMRNVKWLLAAGLIAATTAA